ncbi:MAG: DNA-3-methyladenine glycosylase [Thermoproteota archaeon]|nr:MAG: DNA-3-methyladenine glycosylase [Candidatus Korarchaeota archaeon]RLG54413.1 MAG: DNA-3-methyladenine glycosylase [Candidatus Korarchaeota archaeon]
MRRLGRSFYCQEPVKLAKALLGKLMVHESPEGLTSGVVVETEAYLGRGDRASHGYMGKRTKRNEVLYLGCGLAYVYVAHGHALFNVTAAPPGEPTAVLIRALEPRDGIELMAKRRGLKLGSERSLRLLCSGPGRLTKAMGITKEHNGLDLTKGPVYFTDIGLHPRRVASAPRIGVDYAGEDALKPLRFYVEGSPYVSRK